VPDDPRTDETLAGHTPAAAHGDTIAEDPETIASSPGRTRTPSLPGSSLPGFQLGGLIGRGGMGEVVRGRDMDIGREVAIKRLRNSQASPDEIGRFLREARIQARLEHPAIIPVHTIGRDPDGLPYFTMKKITGVTLAEILASPSPPTRQKILRAFVEASRAVEFAHTRRVVHRDLKPSNIMVGDFGEVYVLDWGLARVLDDTEDKPTSVGDEVVSLDGATQAGAMLGTPGYMAPEQMEDAHSVGTAADVYALGAMLFEILAGEPLHRKGQVLTSTLQGTDVSPAERAPTRNIPPELDALCVAAVQLQADKRPTARELSDRIEGFLDGDRDLEARKRIVTLELEEARDALASGEVGRRVEALQSAGRALALDPKSRDAADIITSIILQPPSEHPPALREQLASTEVLVQRRQGRVATGSFGAILAFLALAAFNGLTNWPLTVGMAVYTIALASVAYQISRREMSSREMFFITIGNASLVALISRIFGSLVIAPAVTCIMALSLTSYPQNIDRGRFVIWVLVASWMIPVGLEWTGILEPTWRVVEGAIVSTSAMVKIGGTATVALLVFANVMTIIVFGLFANKLAISRRDAQRQVEIQAWHLRQLLPT
jgi:eukaryotic-like serine/threonine-protein kinase